MYKFFSDEISNNLFKDFVEESSDNIYNLIERYVKGQLHTSGLTRDQIDKRVSIATEQSGTFHVLYDGEVVLSIYTPVVATKVEESRIVTTFSIPVRRR